MLTLCHNYFNVVPTNKSNKDTGQPHDRRRFIFGLFILFLVDVLWVVSSELTKYIYTDLKLERPFLVTYLRSSLLLVYLIVLCFAPPTRDPCRPADYTQLLEPTAETDDEYFNESNASLGDSTFVPVRAAGETTDSDDAAPRAVRFNKVAEVRVMSAAQAGEALLARLSWAASVRATEHAQRRAAAAATRRHLRLALVFAVPWFVSNYLYRLSLAQARAGAVAVCVAVAGPLAQALGAACAHSAADRFTLLRAAAALLAVLAVVLVATLGGSHTDWTALAAALGSAASYALHLTVFRRELRNAEGINSPLLAGLVGCACAGLAWVLGVALSVSGLEVATLPSPALCSWLLLDAALGPLLLEALWLWGYTLTSAQAATCSLGLAIVLPALWEAWRGRGDAAAGAAAALAAAGWLLAAADTQRALDTRTRLREALHAREGFSAIRSIPELDEQSEALISSEEPT